MSVSGEEWLAQAWARIANRLRPHLVLCRVLVRDLSVVPVDLPAGDGPEIRLARYDELRTAAAAGHASGLSQAFLDQAEARGDVCIAAFDRDEIVAYVWRSFSQAPHDDRVSVQVQAPYWYTYKMHTMPAYRGQRLAGLLTRYGDQVCHREGLKAGVGFVETHNYASLNANRHAGARAVGIAGYLWLFGRALPFRTPGVVRHTFRFVAVTPGAARPESARAEPRGR